MKKKKLLLIICLLSTLTLKAKTIYLHHINDMSSCRHVLTTILDQLIAIEKKEHKQQKKRREKEAEKGRFIFPNKKTPPSDLNILIQSFKTLIVSDHMGCVDYSQPLKRTSIERLIYSYSYTLKTNYHLNISTKKPLKVLFPPYIM